MEEVATTTTTATTAPSTAPAVAPARLRACVLSNVVAVDSMRSLVSRPLRRTPWPHDDEAAGEPLVFQLNAVHVIDTRPRSIVSVLYQHDIICSNTAGNGEVTGVPPYEALQSEEARKKASYRNDPCTTVFLGGVDRDGHSVCVMVEDFRPYFYIELVAPRGVTLQARAQALRQAIARACRLSVAVIECRIEYSFRAHTFDPKQPAAVVVASGSGGGGGGGEDSMDVDAMAAEAVIERRKYPFLRVALPTKNAFYCARRTLLDDAFSVHEVVKNNYGGGYDGSGSGGRDDDSPAATDCGRERLAQENVAFSTQFCLITNTCPSEWIQIENGAYSTTRSSASSYNGAVPIRYTHCGREYTAKSIASIRPYVAADGSAPPSVPLVITSFDIESYSKSGGFPNSKLLSDCCTLVSSVSRSTDSVVHEAQGYDRYSVVYMPSANEVERYLLGRFVYERFDRRLRIDIVASERDLFDRTRDYWTFAIDTNVITGYNIWGYDFEAMKNRADIRNARRFHYGGALIYEQTPIEELKLQSDALGDNVFMSPMLPFKVLSDIMFYIKVAFKPKSMKLKHTAEEFLPQHAGKIDLTPREQFEIFEKQTLETHEPYIEYCDRDAVLPIELMMCRRISYIPNLVAMSRVARTSLQVGARTHLPWCTNIPRRI